MTKITITHFFALIGVLYILSYLSDIISKKEQFGVSLPQKTRQCSKDEINDAYKQYIFNTPPFVRP